MHVSISKLGIFSSVLPNSVMKPQGMKANRERRSQAIRSEPGLSA
jgi:hypothetical protein